MIPVNKKTLMRLKSNWNIKTALKIKNQGGLLL